jgi:hypothetical protein
VRGYVLWRFVQLVHSRRHVFVLRHGADGRSRALEEVHHATSIAAVRGGLLPRRVRVVVHAVLENFTVFANVCHGEHVGFVR